MADQTVGALNITLNMELAKMQAQIDSANKRIAGMAKKAHGDVASMARNMNAALGAIGLGASLSGLIAFGKNVVGLASDITDLSAAANIGTNSFQALSFHFMDSGVSMQELSKAFVLLRKNAQEARDGNKMMADSFRALGIDPAKLQALAMERQIEALGISIANATNQNAAFSAALDILGTKNAPKLLAALKELGVNGYDKVAEATKAVILTPEQIKTLDDAGDRLARIAEIIKYLSAASFVGFGNFLQESGRMLAQGEGIAAPAPRVSIGSVRDTIFSGVGAAETAADQRARLGSVSSGSESWNSYVPQENMSLRGSALAMHADEISATLDQSFADFRTLEDKAAATAASVSTDFVSMAKAAGTFGDVVGQDVKVQNALTDFFQTIDEKAGQSVNMQQLWAEETMRITGGAADAMTTAWVDALNGVEGAFGNLGTVVAREIQAMIVRMLIVIPIMRAIGAAMVGMGMSGAVGSVAGGFLNYGGARAGGGNTDGGKTYLVGEEGPELFTPGASGNITPNSKLAGLSGSGSGTTYSFTYNIPAGVSRADLMPILKAQEQHTIAAVQDMRRRGKAA
jgi:hypothetical protein